MLTDAQWDEAQRRRVRISRVSAGVGTIFVGLLDIPGMWAAIHYGSGFWRYLIGAGAAVATGAPAIAVMVRVTESQEAKTSSELRGMSQKLNEAVALADREAARRDAQASRQQFESRLANALDMAEGEPEVLDVIERSLSSVLPGSPAELLLADNSHAHLVRMASVGYESGEGGCPVGSPTQCPAARRAQVQVFKDSTELDACPKLRQRSAEAISALCVPVSIMGRTVGVIHSTGEAAATPPEEQVHDLATLAKLAGARIGLLRAMAETELQAATDTLTGLLNRRSFEQKMTEARRSHPVLSLAMGDLDHFKTLNDTYGHETGDRALRLFSRVLKESLRGEDLVCRYGGEEFAIAFPACSPADAQRVLDSVRTRLDAAITVSGLPKFTASFGVTEMHGQEELRAALDRADTALFSAKSQGRDRVVRDSPAATDAPLLLRIRDMEYDDEPEGRSASILEWPETEPEWTDGTPDWPDSADGTGLS